MSKFRVNLYKEVKPGKRFTFFLSLLENEASKRQQALGRSAEQHLINIDEALHGTEDANSKDIGTVDKIEQYVKFIGSAAQINRDNEIEFFNTQIKAKIDKITENNSDSKDLQFLQKLQQMLNDLKNTLVKGDRTSTNVNFDYLNFIKTINEVLQDHQKLLDNIRLQKNNMSTINDTFSKLADERKDTIRQAFEQNYSRYQGEIQKDLKEKINGHSPFEQMQSTYADEMARIVQQAVRTITNNQTFIDTIKSYFTKRRPPSDAQLTEIIINILVPYLLQGGRLNTLSEKTEEEIKQIIDTLKPNLNSGIADVFEGQQKMIALEELAMRKQNEFQNLYQAFDNLSQADQADVLNEYFLDPDEKAAMNTLLSNIKASKTTSELFRRKGQFTRLLGLAIQKEMLSRANVSTGALGTLEQAAWEEIQKQSKQYYKERELAQTLPKLLSVRKISAPDIREIIAQQEVQENIVNALVSYLPGKKINLKDDIVFAIEVKPDKQSVNFNFDALSTKIAKAYAGFLPKYHEIAGGETDIDGAIEAFTSQMRGPLKKLTQAYNKASKKCKTEEEALKELSTIFLGGISSKNYYFYENELGYHGGSLGGSNTANAAIDNITKMYETGGITPIDRDRLIFAALNCGTTTVGPSTELQKSLENYLLGGAALMMFDEGFINVSDVLKKIGGEIASKKVKGIDLYYLNGLYIPASYVLESIYQSLMKAFDFIKIQTQDLPTLVENTNNRVVITPHNLTEKDVVYEKKIGKKGKTRKLTTTLERWNATAEKANADTKIQFLFMAGMLDIFEELYKAFEPEFK